MRSLALASILLAIAGCSIPLAQPTPGDAQRAALRWPDASLAQLQRGREAYRARCSVCHKVYQPREEPPERWPSIMDRMAPLARLAAGERQAMQRYLVIMASREEPPPESSPPYLGGER